MKQIIVTIIILAIALYMGFTFHFLFLIPGIFNFALYVINSSFDEAKKTRKQ